MSKRVLITCPQLQKTIDRYRDRFAERDIIIDVPPLVQKMQEAELLEIIDQYDGMVAGDDDVTALVLEKGAPRLKMVAKWGVGVDNVDRVAAERLGIRVVNTPGMFGEEVADVAMGYVILLARRLHLLDQSVRMGGWMKHSGMTLSGKTFGVVGVGSIGQALVRRARAFGMQVLGYDVAPAAVFAEDTGMRFVSLDELLEASDFVVLTCNLTDQNRHLLNAGAFAKMKSGAFLVNVSRGALVDETALVSALKSGRLAGAALDVFETEPLEPESALRQFDNCIFGTHNGSNTVEGVLRVNEQALRNLFEGLEGSMQ